MLAASMILLLILVVLFMPIILGLLLTAVGLLMMFVYAIVDWAINAPCSDVGTAAILISIIVVCVLIVAL